MKSVVEQVEFFLICYSNNLSLVGVKRHQPFTFLNFKFYKVCLKGLAVCLVCDG